MQRLLSAAKLLTIHPNYWSSAYKDWHNLDRDEQLKTKKAKVREISTSLSRIDGAGATILKEMIIDHKGDTILHLPSQTFKVHLLPVRTLKIHMKLLNT